MGWNDFIGGLVDAWNLCDLAQLDTDSLTDCQALGARALASWRRMSVAQGCTWML